MADHASWLADGLAFELTGKLGFVCPDKYLSSAQAVQVSASDD